MASVLRTSAIICLGLYLYSKKEMVSAVEPIGDDSVDDIDR